MPLHDETHDDIRKTPQTWLVTGSAGFIGSHLLETLLRLEQRVVGLDDLSACGRKNLDHLNAVLPPDIWNRFMFIKGDVRDPESCAAACKGVDFVLHHAAIGSVPRSLEDPVNVDRVNVGGFVTMLSAAAAQGVKRFVYASSSAVYGDSGARPNREDQPLAPQSPYAAGKYANELYAATLGTHQGLETIGLRYFNIYGPRQDPDGAYAAVIPKWVTSLRTGVPVTIHGDGETIRDFCHVDDAVRANILAATTRNANAINRVYNIASGQKTSLNALFALLREQAAPGAMPLYGPERPGDIKISQAAIDQAAEFLGFRPAVSLESGLRSLLTCHEAPHG